MQTRLVDEPGDRVGQRRYGDLTVERRGLAEPRQVDRDDLPARGQVVDDGLPRSPPRAEAVYEK